MQIFPSRRALATMFAHFTQETGGHNPHADEEEWRQVSDFSPKKFSEARLAVGFLRTKS